MRFHTLVFAIIGGIAISATTPAPSTTPVTPATAATASPAPAAPSKTPPKPDKATKKCRNKRGGVLYEEYATVIHTKRLRNEFTTAQWKTILLQKRVRVPLTAEDHRDLLEFFVHE